MKERKKLTWRDTVLQTPHIVFQVFFLRSGQRVYRMHINIPGYHTPVVNVELWEFKIQRRGMTFVGHDKNSVKTHALYYSPQKIVT